MTPSVEHPMRLERADLVVPALLVALSLIPTLGAVARLANVTGGDPATLENARFVHSPVPIVIHVLSATLYGLLGALQFPSGLRRRFPGWHRRAGKLLAACGLLAGLTGLWMVVFYRIPTELQGDLLYGVRLIVGAAMVASLIIGWRSILRRDIARHEAFMIRAYALGQGAGTQALVLGPWMVISGNSGGLTRDLLMTLSWAINLAVAERIIRKGASRSASARRRTCRSIFKERRGRDRRRRPARWGTTPGSEQ